MKINNVVIIGSGTMGSGIAAHLCNANIPVTLLDIETSIAQRAKERILVSRPPLLFHKSKINNLNIGNIKDNFDKVVLIDKDISSVRKSLEKIKNTFNLNYKLISNNYLKGIISYEFKLFLIIYNLFICRSSYTLCFFSHCGSMPLIVFRISFLGCV